ncbi:MAG: cyclic nucleotide-binding domain-containing protein [Planctomycetota bacterium]|jgi:CRP-like cAMP-binding protein
MAELGKLYQDGENLMRQGEKGDFMVVIQSGKVLIIAESELGEILVGTAGPGEIVGEMALFEQGVRTATVRASGEVRALRVDKRTFLSRVHKDPSFAFRIVEAMSHRIRALTAEVAHLKERT